jgi:hypothetical protein
MRALLARTAIVAVLIGVPAGLVARVAGLSATFYRGGVVVQWGTSDRCIVEVGLSAQCGRRE